MRRDRAMLEVLYGTGVRISELVGLSLGDVDLDAALLRAFGKGGKERIVPIGVPAVRALVAWLGPGGRPELAPEQWRRRGDAEAVFLNARGGRLSRQGAWDVLNRYARQVGPGGQAQPARAAPLVRHPHARPRCRHPRRAGAARPRLDQHDAGVHAGVDRAAVGGVPQAPTRGREHGQ